MDTVLEFLLNLFYGLGALLAWLIKGSKTPFKDELSEKYQVRNSCIAIVMFAILFGVLIYVINRA